MLFIINPFTLLHDGITHILRQPVNSSDTSHAGNTCIPHKIDSGASFLTTVHCVIPPLSLLGINLWLGVTIPNGAFPYTR